LRHLSFVLLINLMKRCLTKELKAHLHIIKLELQALLLLTSAWMPFISILYSQLLICIVYHCYRNKSFLSSNIFKRRLRFVSKVIARDYSILRYASQVSLSLYNDLSTIYFLFNAFHLQVSLKRLLPSSARHSIHHSMLISWQ
jgi:hypothetical protein